MHRILKTLPRDLPSHKLFQVKWLLLLIPQGRSLQSIKDHSCYFLCKSKKLGVLSSHCYTCTCMLLQLKKCAVLCDFSRRICVCIVDITSTLSSILTSRLVCLLISWVQKHDRRDSKQKLAYRYFQIKYKNTVKYPRFPLWKLLAHRYNFLDTVATR